MTPEYLTIGTITTALDAVVDLIAAAGIPATRDPGDFQPPGAIISAPSIMGAATLQSFALEVPVYLVTDQPGQPGLDWLLEAVTTALDALGETTATPAAWSSPLNPSGLPAYLITARLHVSTS